MKHVSRVIFGLSLCVGTQIISACSGAKAETTSQYEPASNQNAGANPLTAVGPTHDEHESAQMRRLGRNFMYEPNAANTWWLFGAGTPVDGTDPRSAMSYVDPRFPNVVWQISLDDYVQSHLSEHERESLRLQNAITLEKQIAIESLNREIFAKSRLLNSVNREITRLSRPG
jgi:hypothetical protein